jgi:hypothetical protein
MSFADEKFVQTACTERLKVFMKNDFIVCFATQSRPNQDKDPK